MLARPEKVHIHPQDSYGAQRDLFKFWVQEEANLMTCHKFHQSNQRNMTDTSSNQSEFRARGRSFIISGKRRRIRFLSWPAQLKCQRCGSRQTLRNFLSRWSSGTVMAPSTQLKETLADMHEGLRAILLGPPGAGKGTQVRKGYFT